ncbi:MAG: hypothetical protein IPP91_17090 [Betaproteobacteria bacterium]|nr:hypothetical protein [Betaproteobacteria bacterium]
MDTLVETIKDRERWPDFDRSQFLIELNQIADESFEKGSIEGYLASVLVYHQLIEESLRLVLRWSEFMMQLQVAPLEYHLALPKRAMFGQVLEELRNTIDFEHRDDLIAIAERANAGRIKLVHGLTKHKSIDEIAIGAKEIRGHFDDYLEKWEQVHEWFMLAFKDLRKDGEWDALLEDE